MLGAISGSAGRGSEASGHGGVGLGSCSGVAPLASTGALGGCATRHCHMSLPTAATQALGSPLFLSCCCVTHHGLRFLVVAAGAGLPLEHTRAPEHMPPPVGPRTRSLLGIQHRRPLLHRQQSTLLCARRIIAHIPGEPGLQALLLRRPTYFKLRGLRRPPDVDSPPSQRLACLYDSRKRAEK